MEIAALRHLLLTFLVAAACPACLILDPVDFPERENHRPRADNYSPSLGDHIEVNRLQSDDVAFEIDVFDEDASDIFEARAFVNQRRSQNDPTVEVSTGGLVRTVRAVFDEPALDFAKRGCHEIAMYVVDTASAWDEATDHDVKDGFFQVLGVWFVIVHEGDGFEDIAAAGCSP